MTDAAGRAGADRLLRAYQAQERRFVERRFPRASCPRCLMDYAVPRTDEIPPLRIEHLETLSPLNPLGLKGVGESGTLPVAAVLASAIEDALAGVGHADAAVVRQMPLTPRAVAGLARRSG